MSSSMQRYSIKSICIILCLISFPISTTISSPIGEIARTITITVILLYIGSSLTHVVFPEIDLNSHFVLTICAAILIIFINFLALAAVSEIYYLEYIDTTILYLIILFESVILLLSNASPEYDIQSLGNISKNFTIIISLLITLLVAALYIADRSRVYSKIPSYSLIMTIAILAVYLLYARRSQVETLLGIFTIGSVLPLLNTLSYPVLIGRDTHKEYYFSKLVVVSERWIPELGNSFNSLLPTVALTPTLAEIYPASVSDVLMVIYPIFMAILSVSIYVLHEDYLGHQSALFGSLIFMFLFPYYFGLITMPRQQIALLLFTGYLISLKSNLKGFSRIGPVSLLVFSVISHYATAILFLLWTLSGAILTQQYMNIHQTMVKSDYRFTLPKINRDTDISARIIEIIIAGVVLTAWYSHTSSGAFFNNLIIIVYDFYINMIDILSGSQTSQITKAVAGPSNDLYYTITKVLYIVVLFMIGLGCVFTSRLLLQKSFLDLRVILLYLTGGSVVAFLASSIGFPYFDLEPTRLLQIALVIVAPFTIYGFRLVLQNRIIKAPKHLVRGVLLLFISMLLIFNSGLVYDYTEGYPKSATMSMNTIHNQSTTEKYSYYNYYTVQQEDAVAGLWYHDFGDKSATIYSTGGSYYQFESYGMVGPEIETYYGDTKISKQLTLDTDIKPNSYIYKSYINMRENIYTVRRSGSPPESRVYSPLGSDLRRESKIYTTGNSSILWS